MKKNIFLLSFLFSCMGILRSFFFVFFEFQDVTEFLSFIVFSTQPYSFSGLEIYVKRYLIHGNPENGRISVGLLNLTFYLTFLAGTFIYYFSKFKETRLLKFNYSLIFLGSFIKIIFFILLFDSTKHNTYTAVYIVITLLYIYISYRFITKDLNSQELNIGEDEEIKNQEIFDDASKNKRFLNLLIDSLLIFMLIYIFADYAQRNENIYGFLGSFKSAFGNRMGGLLFFCTIKFIYYIFFESIFKSTPAKFLTSCYVTDENGNPPSFSKILKRTLFRFIPFESFSFFSGINMHDNYSCTVVLNNKAESNKENRYLVILGISFIVLFFVYIICRDPYF